MPFAGIKDLFPGQARAKGGDFVAKSQKAQPKPAKIELALELFPPGPGGASVPHGDRFANQRSKPLKNFEKKRER